MLPSYRLYRLDGAGKITTAEWIDADAVRAAEARAGSGKYELWDRRRLICRISH